MPLYRVKLEFLMEAQRISDVLANLQSVIHPEWRGQQQITGWRNPGDNVVKAIEEVVSSEGA